MKKFAFAVFFIFSLFVLPCFAFAVTANITQLVFTTDSQTVAPNTLSKVITVQTQNSSGSQEQVDETNDVNFTSTSATGQFLNSSGAAVSKTMSKNTASRSFYYDDSAQGSFTLTVTITGRTSLKSFTASQSITISSDGGSLATSTATTTDEGGDNQSSATTTPADDTDNSADNSSDGTGGNYANYYSSPIVTSQAEPEFEASAGRDRLTSVGSPISFKAKILKSSGISDTSGNYAWSFGDGCDAMGQETVHSYAYPGIYVVTL